MQRNNQTNFFKPKILLYYFFILLLSINSTFANTTEIALPQPTISDVYLEKVPIYHTLTYDKRVTALESVLTSMYDFLITHSTNDETMQKIHTLINLNTKVINKHSIQAEAELEANNIEKAMLHYKCIADDYTTKITQLNEEYGRLLKPFYINAAKYVLKKYGNNIENSDLNYRITEHYVKKYDVYLEMLGYYAYYLLRASHNTLNSHEQKNIVDAHITTDKNTEGFDLIKVDNNIFIAITWSDVHQGKYQSVVWFNNTSETFVPIIFQDYSFAIKRHNQDGNSIHLITGRKYRSSNHSLAEGISLGRFVTNQNDTTQDDMYERIGSDSITSVFIDAKQINGKKCKISADTTTLLQPNSFYLTMGFIGNAISIKKNQITATMCYDKRCFVSEKRIFALHENGIVVPQSIEVTAISSDFCAVGQMSEFNRTTSVDSELNLFTMKYDVLVNR